MECYDAESEGFEPPVPLRAYCETDVLNTYLIFLRFELLRGHLNAAEHAHEVARVRKLLDDSEAAHFREFAASWPAA